MRIKLESTYNDVDCGAGYSGLVLMQVQKAEEHFIRLLLVIKLKISL